MFADGWGCRMPETPKQFKERTGAELKDNVIVWFISPEFSRWNYMEYCAARKIEDVIMIIADSNGKPDFDYMSRNVI
jgi:hypothetical protein